MANSLLPLLICCRFHTTAIPENSYIQMDNTSRENKKRYVLAFVHYLSSQRYSVRYEVILNDFKLPIK